MIDGATVNFQIPIDANAEDLDIEFKRALPLRENAGKAKLAKEVGALSNHGGGWIVLGREDDGTYPENLPDELAGVDQDTINQIASAYLQPAPHCSVSWVKPNGVAFKVLVIWVPAAGTSPVCGLKNGPNGENGKTVGVKRSVHYMRKAGPASAPIESPDEWQTVIRRCVLSDKTALLGALTTMIEQPLPTPTADDKSLLDADFEHIIEKWKEHAEKTPYKVDLSGNFVCFGFHLLDAEATTIDRIKECLQSRPADTLGGYQYFDDGYNAPNNPVVIENADVDGLDCYATSDQFDQRFAWRLSEAMAGVEIVSYWEDTAWIKDAAEHNSSRTWERGEKIWIEQQIAYTNNFLAIVKHFADYFEHERDVRICVLFSGLQGRSLGSPNSGGYYCLNYEAHQNTKQVDFTVKKNALEPEVRSATISAIIQPMNKLTQGPKITAEYVIRSLEARR